MRLAIIVACALLAAAAAPASAAELKIASPQRGSWEGSVPELGRDIFRKHGLDLDILYTAGGGETLQAGISGAVDIGLSARPPGLPRAHPKGAPGRIVSARATRPARACR